MKDLAAIAVLAVVLVIAAALLMAAGGATIGSCDPNIRVQNGNNGTVNQCVDQAVDTMLGLSN